MQYDNINQNITLSKIISHRPNSIDSFRTDYLFEIISNEQINDEFYIPSENQYINDRFIYHVWIKDTFCLFDYTTYVSSDYYRGYSIESFINKIHEYCCQKDIKIIYSYIHRQFHSVLFPTLLEEENQIIESTIEDNYQKQIDSINYLRTLFPNHKIIDTVIGEDVFDSYTYRYECLSRVMRIMKKGDCFYTFNVENQRIKESDVILLTKRFKNIPTPYAEIMNIRRHNSARCSNFRILTENYITILDQDFYYKKIAIDTLVLATHNRISKNSSLRVLPRHLLREIGMWL